MRKILFCLILIIITLSNIKITGNTNYTVLNNNKMSSNSVLKKYNYVSGYKCKKVTVVNKDGSLDGKYSLEDYVAGVVSGETHILDDFVTFEAMSVAIRTYTLYVTDDCRYPIINSEAHQVMGSQANVTKEIRSAVANTKGQVLTYNGKLINSEYDSFYMGEGFYCNKKYCYATYNKVGNKNVKKHKVKVPSTWREDLSGGHGNGLSQYGAKYLSMQGYTYDRILKYFYADGVVISTIVKPNVDGLEIKDNFITRKTRPLRNNSFYYTKGNANYLEGESNWYATSRANEILTATNSNKRLKYINTNEYCSLNNFNTSTDYQNPQAGSIISWGNHVAIIENVHDDMVDITEAYISLGSYGNKLATEHLHVDGMYYNSKTNKQDRKYNCENNKSGCFKRTDNIKISELKNRWGYDFKCYVYLVD